MNRSYVIGRFETANGKGMLRGDHDLNPGMDMPPPAEQRLSAVLVPIVERPEGLTVLFTQRTDHLANHPGQISFPGGRCEPSDPTIEDAALRETEEEIGLGRNAVTLIGRLDDYVTRTGFRVTPVVGLVRPPFDLVPDPEEVAEIFEVPLAFLMDPVNHRQFSRRFRGVERAFYAVPFGRYYIWGATAGMLMSLYDRLVSG